LNFCGDFYVCLVLGADFGGKHSKPKRDGGRQSARRPISSKASIAVSRAPLSAAASGRMTLSDLAKAADFAARHGAVFCSR